MNINLAWDPPTTNTDGSPLTSPIAYRVYWGLWTGTATAPVYGSVAGTQAAAETHTSVTNLPASKVWFAVTALCGTLESDYSEWLLVDGTRPSKPGRPRKTL
jgi:hypothetical protein